MVFQGSQDRVQLLEDRMQTWPAFWGDGDTVPNPHSDTKYVLGTNRSFRHINSFKFRPTFPGGDIIVPLLQMRKQFREDKLLPTASQRDVVVPQSDPGPPVAKPIVSYRNTCPPHIRGCTRSARADMAPTLRPPTSASPHCRQITEASERPTEATGLQGGWTLQVWYLHYT